MHVLLCSVRLTSPSDLLHYGIATHYIPQQQLQVRGSNTGAPDGHSTLSFDTRKQCEAGCVFNAMRQRPVCVSNAVRQRPRSLLLLPPLQEFKQQLAEQPAALQQLLQQHSQPPPDAPGPLQRLMAVVEPHMQQLVDSWHAAGCEELQALHRLIQQLQQVRRGQKGCPCTADAPLDH